MTKTKVDDKMDNLLDELTPEEYTNWVVSWLNMESVYDIHNNWEQDIKKDTIIELQKIIKNRK